MNGFGPLLLINFYTQVVLSLTENKLFKIAYKSLAEHNFTSVYRGSPNYEV